jgi:hypothetical protein
VVRPTSTHDLPESRCITTTRPARTGDPAPDNVKAALVSTDAGADKDSPCLTTAKLRVAETPCAAATVETATARHDILDPTAPARTELENRPVEPVTTDTTVDHDAPPRCNHTTRPGASGETTPERTTDSAAKADAGATVSDTAEATADCACACACAEGTTLSGETIANTAAKATSARRSEA